MSAAVKSGEDVQLKLYDDFARADPMPARSTESSFEFINRVDQPFWGRVRTTTEAWFADFPEEPRADLRARFRKADENQHWPAWWELYLFTLFSRLGFKVDVHPDLPNSGNHPDFLVSANGSPVAYVEAVCANTGAIIAPERHATREARLIDIINEVPHRGFHVWLDIDSTGPADLRRKYVKKLVEAWVRSVDEPSTAEPLVIERDGWAVRLTAMTAGERTGARPLISFGAGIAGMMDDIGALRAVAERKRRHYPVSDIPLVLAILMKNDPSDEDCIERLLFGDRVQGAGRMDNGLWSSDEKIQNPRPDALMVANSIHPWTAPKRIPALITAPGREALRDALDLPGDLQTAEDPVRACQLLELAADWPGPEASFVGI